MNEPPFSSIRAAWLLELRPPPRKSAPLPRKKFVSLSSPKPLFDGTLTVTPRSEDDNPIVRKLVFRCFVDRDNPKTLDISKGYEAKSVTKSEEGVQRTSKYIVTSDLINEAIRFLGALKSSIQEQWEQLNPRVDFSRSLSIGGLTTVYNDCISAGKKYQVEIISVDQADLELYNE